MQRTALNRIRKKVMGSFRPSLPRCKYLLCGIEFTPRRTSGRPQLFCSVFCRQQQGELLRNPEVIYCAECGTFIVERLRVYGFKPYKRCLECIFAAAMESGEFSHLMRRVTVDCGFVKPTSCHGCGKPETRVGILALDHDHDGRFIRGWLCQGCNIAIGHARDSPPVLRKLADYLYERSPL